MGTAHLRSPPAGTATPFDVASSITSVTILAANANRLGATIHNDSNSRLKLKFAATASATSFTKILQSQEFWPVPFTYTGIIDGIWAPFVSGFARVWEFTA